MDWDIFIHLSRLLSPYMVVPLGMGFICAVLEKFKRGAYIAEILATVSMAFLLLLSLGTLLHVHDGGSIVRWVGNWQPQTVMGISRVLDGLSALMLVTINMVGFAVTLFSLNYMRRFTSRGYFWALFLIMVAAMNGVVLTGDLFNLYVFLEIAAIASYGLVAFGCEREELEAAFKYLIQGSIASALILLGIGIMYNLTGTLNMAEMAQQLARNGFNTTAMLGAAFFLMGFGLKAALVPFHAWLPDAHPSAPAPISAMLSGVLIKAIGIYSLCRIFFNVIGVNTQIAWLLIALGTLSMVIGVFLAIGQMDLKRLLAYHSISQMGYVVLSLGVGAELLSRPELSDAMRGVAGLAILGGLFHMFNHATFKSLLFLTSGAIEQQTGTRILTEMGGLTKRMPVTATCCRIASLSIAGVPPFNGFFSKLIIVIAVLSAGHYWLGAVTVFVSFMTLCSFIKVQRYALHGKVPPALEKVREAPFFMCVGMILLTLVCCVGGLGVLFYGSKLLDPARDVLLQSPGQYAEKALKGHETDEATTIVVDGTSTTTNISGELPSTRSVAPATTPGDPQP